MAREHPLTLFPENDCLRILGPVVFNTFVMVAQAAQRPDRTRAGGCFAFWRPMESHSKPGTETPQQVVGLQVGNEPSPEKIADNWGLAMREASRLFLRPHDITSKDNGDPGQSSSAIRLESRLIFSFAGFNAAAENEAMCVLVAGRLGLASTQYARQIIEDRNNSFLQRFIHQLHASG